MSENVRLGWGVSRVAGDTLDLLNDEENRIVTLSILQCSVLRQMVYPWVRFPDRLVDEFPDYQTIVEMPEVYLDALDDLELMLGGGYTPPEVVQMGDRFVDRGDPNANDFAIGTGLTADGTWRVLTLGGIVTDADATRVLLRGYFKDTVVGQVCSFRSLGRANAYNTASRATQVNSAYVYYQCQVYMPQFRSIEYLISSGMDVATLVVQGWWVPTYGYGA